MTLTDYVKRCECEYIKQILAKKYPWKWTSLSYNPNITWDIVEKNMDQPWIWSKLSSHPNITWEIIQANPDRSWNLNCVSLNRNITWDVVQANPDTPWDWACLSRNPSLFKIDMPRVLREYFAQRTIAKHWRTAIGNPEYSVCRKRLMKEYGELEKI